MECEGGGGGGGGGGEMGVVYLSLKVFFELCLGLGLRSVSLVAFAPEKLLCLLLGLSLHLSGKTLLALAAEHLLERAYLGFEAAHFVACVAGGFFEAFVCLCVGGVVWCVGSRRSKKRKYLSRESPHTLASSCFRVDSNSLAFSPPPSFALNGDVG